MPISDPGPSSRRSRLVSFDPQIGMNRWSLHMVLRSDLVFVVLESASYLRTTTMVFLAAFCTANGGGTIRDILSNQLPFWISSPEYILIPGISRLLMVSMKVIRMTVKVRALSIPTSGRSVLPCRARRDQAFTMFRNRFAVGIEGRKMRFASLVSCFVQPDLSQPSAKVTLRLFHALRLRVARPLRCFKLLLRTGECFAGRSILLRRHFQCLGELPLLALKSLPPCDNALRHK